MSFPDWYLKEKKKARHRLKNAKPAKYGIDIALEDYQRQGRRPKKIESLKKLGKYTQERLESVGERADEQFRCATHLQQDNITTYLNTIKGFLPEGVVVMDTDRAIKKFNWFKNYYFKIMPKNLNKYTVFVNAYSQGGIFIWIKEGIHVKFPLQACFYLQSSNYVQIPHSFIIAEPHSKIHLISGCVTDKDCKNSAHIAVTEVFVKEGAEVTWTMIHNWGKHFHVRPNVGIKVEKRATLISNYLLTSEVKSIQSYPTAILAEGARAVFNTMLFCRGRSQIDSGSAIYFNGKDSKGEIKSRALILDNSRVALRGHLSGNKKCLGHLECKGLILSKEAVGRAYPNLSACEDAELTHEAAMGKVRNEEMDYLMTRGFSKDEATSLIARGFISLDIPGLPATVNNYVKEVIEATGKKSI
ncbi:MAG: SufD family Fe-S cluster assembly protein [Candidatus Omnitrophica bacterium]|nr:SufD family Fe-S cluster assembly protein [Candidatus Omnitrophota bacterium]